MDTNHNIGSSTSQTGQFILLDIDDVEDVDKPKLSSNQGENKCEVEDDNPNDIGKEGVGNKEQCNLLTSSMVRLGEDEAKTSISVPSFHSSISLNDDSYYSMA